MMFAKPLRARVSAGEITQSIRVWMHPRVRVGGRYPLLHGAIADTDLTEIDLGEVTDEVARAGGFETLDALMKTARHGRGERVFKVEFRFISGSDE